MKINMNILHKPQWDLGFFLRKFLKEEMNWGNKWDKIQVSFVKLTISAFFI